MSVQFDWNVTADADLVGAAAAGDRSAFAEIYDRYADRLYDFCVRIAGDSDAADCVQETFFTAAVDLPALRDPDKLRPWLYSIARHQALRTLRAHKRETATDALPDEASADAGPDVLAARNELAELIAQAEGGLSDNDRQVLDLAYRHGLTGPELAQTLGVSNAVAKKMVQRLRDTVEKSLGALLVIRQVTAGHHDCPELAASASRWDGQFTILMRKRISRHIESCPNCNQERNRLVNPRALLGSSALFVPAPAWLRDEVLSKAGTGRGAVSAAATPVAGGRVAAGLAMLSGRFTVLAATIGVIPVAVWGLMAGGPTPNDEQVTPSPADVSAATTVSATNPPSEPPVPSTTTWPAPSISAPQPSSPMPPQGPASTSLPAAGDQPGQPAPSPAPATADTPQAPATAPSTTSTAPPSASRVPIGRRPQLPSLPTGRHCPDGSVVSVDQNCPAPSPTQASNCPHISVGAPVCGRAVKGH